MKRHSRFQIKGRNRQKHLESSNGVEIEKNQGKRYSIKKYLAEYAKNSNLHGLKYIGENERTTIERYFWLIAFSCCVLLCGVLITNVYMKWDRMPVIVTFAENTTPVWQIPFPAVTVCFEAKSLQRRFNITKYYHMYLNQSTYKELPKEERHIYENVCLLCDLPEVMAPYNSHNVSDGKKLVQNIVKVAPKIGDFIRRCEWRGKKVRCQKLFSPILTEEGLCYTFNTLGAQQLFRLENMHKEYTHLDSNKSSQNWSKEHGYDSTAPMDTYPYRGLGHGIKAGLAITFAADQNDLDYACTGAVQGYKILLHDPAKLPQTNQQFYRIPLSREVILAVTPKVMTTSYGLKSYSSSQRKCYFQSNRYLRYFQIYTQSNCQIECLTNFTYARCGCVHFGMPHAPDMQVCSKISDLICLREARMDLITAKLQLDQNTGPTDTRKQTAIAASQCNCLPGCFSIKYKAEVSQAYYNIEAYFKAHQIEYDSVHNMKVTHLKIFFEESQFIASGRSELYGLTDFLANCGGLLGLCMGFSILSVAEIIYFLTLRILSWRKRSLTNMIDIRE